MSAKVCMRLQTETHSFGHSSESNLIFFFYQRALALRTRTSTSRRFNLKVLHVLSKRDTPGSFILPFFSPKEIVRLFIPKEVKPSPDSKMMLKLCTFDDLFPPLRHSR